MAGYSEGTKVEWDWGDITAKGKVVKVYTQKQTLKQLVSQAEGDPALLAAALEQVKAVMR